MSHYRKNKQKQKKHPAGAGTAWLSVLLAEI